jgi:hypothetical protein
LNPMPLFTSHQIGWLSSHLRIPNESVNLLLWLQSSSTELNSCQKVVSSFCGTAGVNRDSKVWLYSEFWSKSVGILSWPNSFARSWRFWLETAPQNWTMTIADATFVSALSQTAFLERYKREKLSPSNQMDFYVVLSHPNRIQTDLCSERFRQMSDSPSQVPLCKFSSPHRGISLSCAASMLCYHLFWKFGPFVHLMGRLTEIWMRKCGVSEKIQSERVFRSALNHERFFVVKYSNRLCTRGRLLRIDNESSQTASYSVCRKYFIQCIIFCTASNLVEAGPNLLVRFFRSLELRLRRGTL